MNMVLTYIDSVRTSSRESRGLNPAENTISVL